MDFTSLYFTRLHSTSFTLISWIHQQRIKTIKARLDNSFFHDASAPPPSVEPASSSSAGPSQPLDPAVEWSMEEWLTTIGLAKYIPTFLEHNLLTLDTVKRLDVKLLRKEVGIEPLGDRIQIIDAAQLL